MKNHTRVVFRRAFLVLFAPLVMGLASCGGGGGDSGGGGQNPPPPPPPTDNDPTVSWVSPQDNDTVSGMVTLEGSATDDNGVSKVEFFDEGASLGSDTTSPYSLDWDTTSVADGNHSLKVVATDSGNNTAEKTITVTVDNAPPDSDGDGVPDAADACPFDPTSWIDVSGDGVCDTESPKASFGLYSLSQPAVLSTELSSYSPTICAYEASSIEYHVFARYWDAGEVRKLGDIAEIELFDDGQGVDTTAGDHFFCGKVTPNYANPTNLALVPGKLDAFTFDIQLKNAAGNYLSPDEIANVRPFEPTLGVLVVDPSALVQTNVLSPSVKTANRVINVVVGENQFDACNRIDIANVTQKVYGAFPNSPDPFDFMVTFKPGMLFDNGNPAAYRIKNDYTHNALGLFDHTSTYGSAGRLRGVVCQTDNIDGVAISHEFAHFFVGYYSFTDSYTHYLTAENPAELEANGCLEPDGQDYIRGECVGSRHHYQYNEVTMRSMSLLCPNEMQGERYATVIVPPLGTILASQTVIADDAYLENETGPMNPSCTASQKDFRAAFVVVTENELADDVLLSGINALAEYLSGNYVGEDISVDGYIPITRQGSFSWKTWDRATLETLLPPQ